MIRFRILVCEVLVVLLLMPLGQSQQVVADSLFPADIQAQFDLDEFTLTESGFVNQFIAYYFFNDQNGDEQFLMRYEIGGSSVHGAEFDGAPKDIPLSGFAWLGGFRTENAMTCCVGKELGAGFQIYLEQIEPINYPISNFPDDTFGVNLTVDAIEQGSGSFSWLIKDYFPTGDMVSTGPVFCLGFECEIGGSINLLGFDFVEQPSGEFVLELNNNENRTDFYDHYSGAPEYKGQPFFNVFQTFELGSAGSTGSGIPGDVNGDQLVNLLDVDPFVELLNSGCYQLEADVLPDGMVDLLDVTFFVFLLGNQ